ncbi:MAG: hypothetical protein PHF00_05420, partial [Elusimicrobia bacterium]|nr:hypothetical protein [Elusimicrobiota bacterium]
MMRVPLRRRGLSAALAAVVFILAPGPQAWAQAARASASVKAAARFCGVPVLPALDFAPGLPAGRAADFRLQAVPAVPSAPRLSGLAVAAPLAPAPIRAAARPSDGAPASAAGLETAGEGCLALLAAGVGSLRRADAPAEQAAQLGRLYEGEAGRRDADGVPVAERGAGPAALAGPQEAVSASAPSAASAPVPAADDFNRKAVVTLFVTRTLSITSFVLTSIAYPFLAAPVVGWALYGTLMALGPLAAIAMGPLNGIIADTLSARNAMAINVALRAALALVLPACSWFGALNFWTLLVSSVANGWILSSTMTTDNTYIRRFVGSGPGSRARLEAVNALASIHYVGLQVLLGLIIGIGSIIDQINPVAAFLASAAVHGLVVLPILWLAMPNIPPSARRRLGSWVAPAQGFLRAYWKELLLLGAGVGAYAWLGSPLTIAGALFYWVLRTKTVRDLRAGLLREPDPREARIAERLAELESGAGAPAEIAALKSEAELYRRRQFRGLFYQAGQAILTFPLQNFVLPLIAATLMGASGKALLLGKLLGAVFFGNLIANSSQAKLPGLKIPFVGRLVAGQRLVQGGVLAMAAIWVYTSLFPGSIPAVLAAVAAAAGLMWLAGRLSQRGWIKFLGAGLAAIWLPYLVWTGALTFMSVPTALFLSMLVYGMFTGPASVSFSTYIQTSTRNSDLGKIFGVGSSFFNTFNSLGYGLLTAAAGMVNPVFPALLLP